MKRVACWACNETGFVHVQDKDDPFVEIPTTDKCLNCNGRGYFVISPEANVVSLIDRAPDWFTKRQWRMRANSRWHPNWPHNAA